MPASAGDVYVLSHRLLHWAGKPSQRADKPSISIAFDMADQSFQSPVLKREADDPELVLKWEERLALCAYLILKHSGSSIQRMSGASSSHAQHDFIQDVLTKHRSHLTQEAQHHMDS